MIEAVKKPFDDQEKVRILLHEYDTLRQEIIQRTTHGFQIYGVGAVFFVWLVSRPFDQRSWIMLCVSALAVLFASRISLREIRNASERLQELEQTINRLAGQDLLIWESCRGGAKTGPRWLWGGTRSKTQITMKASESETKTPASGCHSNNQLAGDQNQRGAK
jgi:hypothetical protein